MGGERKVVGMVGGLGLVLVFVFRFWEQVGIEGVCFDVACL